ncbi:hypothetical protein AVEN_47366-1 [Araneus ventricosus]|uniref:Uncharacterized protein n=1 Tax=Araneus ventricosus TaxID=182803 RepID=A0A4Y2TL94_ARAVE|nr:hypothetical protein AVEN_47366-1 [Araneus ventricosus]
MATKREQQLEQRPQSRVLKEAVGGLIMLQTSPPQIQLVMFSPSREDIFPREESPRLFTQTANHKPATHGALVVRKSRKHPTVGIDHWGDRRLVVGRMSVRLSSGKKGRRSTPSGTNKTGVLDIKERRAVKNRLGSLERVSDSGSAGKSCVINSD